MAKNDIILLDGIIDQRLATNTDGKRDEIFEKLALEEILKNYDLGSEEIESGWIDGNGDGGIDGFYTFVNGHLVDDIEEFIWPKTSAAIDVWLITCKHHPKFAQSTLDALLATIQEVFDLSLDNGDLKGAYSEPLLHSRELLMVTYKKLAMSRPTVHIEVVYASRGDAALIGDSVSARASQITQTLEGLFSSSKVACSFWGSAELIESHRKIRAFSLEIPFVEYLSTGKESYVLLVKLHDYWKFVSDEVGNLRRYLFDSNVRDYLGGNGVNEDIAKSLCDPLAPDFWWLNNGVTILATNATVPGKSIQLQDIQIVNGLQTTETIFNHFKNGSDVSSNRVLLVKIIVTQNSAARDKIIRATNNQSPVEIASLHATDKIQRDIEEILERNDWFYERRKNYYKNAGKPQLKFVTPSYIASAVVALIFKNIPIATKIKTKFMRDQTSYDDVFSSDFPLVLWPQLAGIYKLVDDALIEYSKKFNYHERTISNWRPIAALLIVAQECKTFNYSITDLLNLEIGKIKPEVIQNAIRTVSDHRNGVSRSGVIRESAAIKCCKMLGDLLNIPGIECVGRRNIKRSPFSLSDAEVSTLMTERKDLIDSVDARLPDQPWKPGVHLEVAAQLGLSKKEVQLAIQALIFSGRRYHQHMGIVYNKTGDIIATSSHLGVDRRDAAVGGGIERST